MIDILAIISNKKKLTLGGWYSFNAICCEYRGHKRDTRGRAGIKLDENSGWVYSCFNCAFKAGFTPGKTLTKNTRQLLEWCGLSKEDIEIINFKSFSLKENDLKIIHKVPDIQFKRKLLPPNSIPLNPNVHIDAVNYLLSRGLSPTEYNYYVVENESRPRIIIPYYYKGEIVGHTSRFYDDRKPKYISDQQSGYLFNIDAQREHWKYCILVEGQIDALSIDAVAYMSSNISTDQQYLLSTLNRKIIVVPDHDKSGMNTCDQALNLGYDVSIPNWDHDIKDVNDAVRRYGKIPTILSIIQCATQNRIKIEIRRNKYK